MKITIDFKYPYVAGQKLEPVQTGVLNSVTAMVQDNLPHDGPVRIVVIEGPSTMTREVTE